MLLQRVFESSFVGRRSIVKERFSKKYRHPLLDSKLTLKRLNAVSFLSMKFFIARRFCDYHMHKNRISRILSVLVFFSELITYVKSIYICLHQLRRIFFKFSWQFISNPFYALLLFSSVGILSGHLTWLRHATFSFSLSF